MRYNSITRDRAIKEGWFIPNDSGLCMCGCGGTVDRATQSHRRSRHVSGEYKRYLPNHGTIHPESLDVPKGMKFCGECATIKPYSEFHKNKRTNSGYAIWCRSCMKEYSAKRSQRFKRQVMDAYGGKCICCGEDRLVFLAIDHINNDGAAHRRELGGKFLGVRFYNWLIKHGFPEGFQVLCMNCNWAKQFGECPHGK